MQICDVLVAVAVVVAKLSNRDFKARNISTQHVATLLRDVATCVDRGGQTHATFSSFSTQHANVHVPQAPGAQEVDRKCMP